MVPKPLFMKAVHFIKKHKIWIGSIWGVLTTILSIYLTINPLEQNPRLTLYEKSKLDLFAIDEPVEELQVVLNGKDLKKKNLNLKVYQFKLINNGKRDIRRVDYAEEVPFGIHIKNGKMAKIYINKAHKTYASRKFLNKQYKDSTKINFNKIFLGQKEYISFDLWVEYEKDKEPSLALSGKIADTSIELTNDAESRIQEWWSGVILPIFLIILVIIAIPWFINLLHFCSDFIQRKFRKEIIKKRYDHHYDRTNKRHRLIAKIYSLYGRKEFIRILSTLINNNLLKDAYLKELENEEIVDLFIELQKNGKTTLSKSEKIDRYDSPILNAIDLLNESELVTINEDLQEISIDNEILADMRFVLKLLVIDYPYEEKEGGA